MMRAVAMIGVLSAALLVGCGPAAPTLFPASGTITLGGKPLEGATVTFMPASGPPSNGMTDASGKYTIMTGGKPGAVAGACQVAVTKAAGSVAAPAAGGGDPRQQMEEMQKKMVSQMQAMQNRKPGEVGKSEIPEKFTRPDTSGLTANVTADGAKNVFDFALTAE